MSFLDHLGELRTRLIVCIAAIFTTTLFIGLPLSERFVELLLRPLRVADIGDSDAPLTIEVAADGTLRLKDAATTAPRAGTLASMRINFEVRRPDGQMTVIPFGPRLKQNLYYRQLFDPFIITLKAAMLVGIALAVPVWLWQLWAFVSPAFTPAEIRWVRPIFMAALILFPIGSAFSYFMLRFAFEVFFRAFAINGLEPWLDPNAYISFVLMFMLLFGAVFETPLIVILLVRLKVVTTEGLRRTRKYAILVIAILAACLTPPDPLSMIMMGVPLWLLYEASIWISVALEQRIGAPSSDAAEA